MPKPNKHVELGTIQYVNLSKDGRHGDYETAALHVADGKKPIFANFVEWPGWQGKLHWH